MDLPIYLTFYSMLDAHTYATKIFAHMGFMIAHTYIQNMSLQVLDITHGLLKLWIDYIDILGCHGTTHNHDLVITNTLIYHPLQQLSL